MPGVKEYTDPETGISFLGISASSYEDAEFNIHTTSYLIQSPKDCPVRFEFVIGKITWEEYWTHSEWLIELKKPSIFSQEAEVRYIKTHELPEAALRILRSSHLKSPIQMKLRNLEAFLDRKDFHPERNPSRRIAYQKFLNQYGKFLDLDAASGECFKTAPVSKSSFDKNLV
jgi:hypothetical protein